jgi:hypothetical protein
MHSVVFIEAVVVIELGWVRWGVDLSERRGESQTDPTYHDVSIL